MTTIPDTPGGDTDIVTFQLWGQSFQAINAGPLFSFNPSISFAVACDTVEDVDRIWARLAEGGTPLMPLDTYPFSERYGWTQDRYGLSWQVSLRRRSARDAAHHSDADVRRRRVRQGRGGDRLLHVGPARLERGFVQRYGPGQEPDAEGTVQYGAFQLAGQGSPPWTARGTTSSRSTRRSRCIVYCDNQDEIDRYWDALSAVPEAEQCGWLKDRYGVSWQIVPADMDEMLQRGTKEQVARVTAAFLAMKKFDLAELERAYAGP